SILPFSETTGVMMAASQPGAARRRPPAASPPMPEKVGRYEILEPIGRGGLGFIYKARDLTLDRIVALKVLPTVEPERFERFERETVTMAQLRHPGLLPIYDVGKHQSLQYFVMPFVEGGNLAQNLDRYHGDPKTAVRLMEKVARAVQFAHEL